MNKKIKDWVKSSIWLDCVCSRCKDVANLLLGQSVLEFMISIHGYQMIMGMSNYIIGTN